MQRFPEVFLGVLLAVAIFALGMGFESARQPPANYNAADTADQSRRPIVEQGNPNKLTDWFLVLLNFFLVGSTLMLWRANNQSAKIAERALTELEAPFVSLKITSPGIDFKKGNISFGYLKWRVLNHGRTPATILEIFDDIRQVEEGKGLPAPITPSSDVGSPMPYGVIAPPSGESEDFPYLAISAILDQGEVNLAISNKNAFFIGYVRYADILDKRFILGFCFLFDRDSNRWLLIGGDGHNYRREDKSPPPPSWYQPTSDSRGVRADLYRTMRMHGEQSGDSAHGASH